MPEPPWELGVLRSFAKVLADTTDGLNGSEIGDLLLRLGDGRSRFGTDEMASPIRIVDVVSR